MTAKSINNMSDQYDFRPLSEDEIKQMRRIAFGFAAFIALLFLFAFAGCAEKEATPTLDERLQGAWTRNWTPSDATTNYSFDGNGQCFTYTILPGIPVHFVAWSYSLDMGILEMTDMATKKPFQVTRRALVSFPTDSTAVLSWENGIDYRLTKL